MDFEMHYTEEQEKFRAEVSAWLDVNMPPEAVRPVDEGRKPPGLSDAAMSLRRRLGAKGWLCPLWPKEYGGGDLPVEQAVIIGEELDGRHAFLPYDLGVILIAPAIMVWGTDDQKRRFLPPILSGEILTWQVFTEPEAGTDLASLKLRADKEGDHYVLNGQKTFIGSDYRADWLYTLAVTDQNRPRHSNIGAFIVPANSPGVTISPMELIAGQNKNNIYYDNVRVSRDQLIGGEFDGWKVANSTLELEHGGASRMVEGHFVDLLLAYCRRATRNGQPLSKDPAVRDALVEIWMGAQVERLFNWRNYWMRTSKIPWSWEGCQTALFRKQSEPRVAHRVLDILGPYALTTDPKLQALRGEIENQQRMSIMSHPGGTPEAQKIVMARRIGIAKTRQKASAIV
ncbi:MAG: acyl-CoA dehydrogenase family protein [Chloroflexi bacterium]|nr:acyl-CoA dehydrogenase family protein [Chloroflexota bacterium]